MGNKSNGIKTIPFNLTEDQYSFFENIAREMTTQGNRATEFPLFCIYQKEKIPAPEDIAEFSEWHNSDRQKTIDENEIDETIKEYLYENPEEEELKLDNEAYLEKMGYEKVFYNVRDVPVSGQVYLTEKAAQHHIDCNSYHYHEPFIYVEAAWRNPELQMIMQLMFAFCPAGTNDHQWHNAYRIYETYQTFLKEKI